MKYFLYLASVLIMAFNSGRICAGESHEFFEVMGKIRINWNAGYVIGKGMAHPAAQYGGNSDVRRRMALNEAKEEAVKNLFKAVWTIRIDSETRVGDLASYDVAALNQIIDIIRDLPVIENKTLDDGFLEVSIRMNLRDEFSQMMLPENIEKLESIKPVASKKREEEKHYAQGQGKEMPQDVFTGLVVNAKDIGAKPAMSPRILDEEGNEIYGAAFASREFASRKGMSGYMTDVKAAEKSLRVKKRPLIVRGLMSGGSGHSDIVISNLDASKLRESSEHLIFLKKCGVIVVID